MKQKDIATFIIVAFVSAVISLVASNYLFTSSKDKIQKTEIVDPISADFKAPDSNDQYFNAKANNPTKLIQIGDKANADPYKEDTNN
jgi:hypothetical protein